MPSNNGPMGFQMFGVTIKVFKGKVLSANARLVNPNMVTLMERLCTWMITNGYDKLSTHGIRNNRLMRSVSKTSRHSDGTYPGYKSWPDGTVGSYGIDIEGFYGPGGKQLTIRNKADKRQMVEILESLGYRVYHKGKIEPEHLHAEYPNPTRWR